MNIRWRRLWSICGTQDALAPIAEREKAEWTVDPSTESWWYAPPSTPEGFHEVQVRQQDGYDFARLVWEVCAECEIGLISKIRVTGPWQRQGYGSRMVRFALRGQEAYSWSTTPQSNFGRAFFPVIAETTGVEFPARTELCAHMRERGPYHAAPYQLLDPPPH